MEYSNELDRMKNRKKKQQYSGSTRRTSPDELDIIDFREVEEKQPRKKPKKRRKKFRFLLLELLILVVLAGAAFYFLKPQLFGSETQTGYWTVAVFGVDSRDGNLNKGALSDVEMLCVVDRATGEMKLVSVYRDTYLQIDADGTYHKINEAYFKGGHEQAVNALERNLDLKIDNYATFNWKAVADVINILGGIDLEISDSEFAYINAFITETVNSTGVGSVHLERAGMNHLDGVQAVAYARLRLMDTDYNRTARQRKVISLAMEKAKQADFSVLNNIMVTVLPQISTDIGLTDLLPMAKDMGKYHIGVTDGFPFSRGTAKISKRDCVVPLTLESNVIQLHAMLYGIENYQPSAKVKAISEQIAKDSGMGEVAENAPKAEAGGNSGGTPVPGTQTAELVVEESTEETEESTEELEEESMFVEENSDDKITGPGMNLKETTLAAKPTPPDEENNSEGPIASVEPSPENPSEGTVADENTAPVVGPGM